MRPRKVPSGEKPRGGVDRRFGEENSKAIKVVMSKFNMEIYPEDITQESPAYDPSPITFTQLGDLQLPTTASQSISHFPTGLW